MVHGKYNIVSHFCYIVWTKISLQKLADSLFPSKIFIWMDEKAKYEASIIIIIWKHNIEYWCVRRAFHNKNLPIRLSEMFDKNFLFLWRTKRGHKLVDHRYYTYPNVIYK